MTKTEFNKLVEVEKKQILNGDAQELLEALRIQYLYRNFGIKGYSVDVILTEIAQAKIVGCFLIESNLIQQHLEEN